MVSPIPSGVVGYCAVVVRDRDLWQGLFIAQNNLAMHTRTLAVVRDQLAAMEGGPAPRVIESLSWLPEADQITVGTLAASLVEVVETSKDGHAMAFSGALRLLLGIDYFWIEAWHDNDGIRTILHPMPLVTTPEAARAFVNALPMVQAMKARTFEEAVRNYGKPRH